MPSPDIFTIGNEPPSLHRRDIKKVSKTLKKIDELDGELDLKQRVQFYQEIFLDSQVLESASGCVKNSVQSIDIKKSYDSEEFACNIKRNLEIKEQSDKKKLLELKELKETIMNNPEIPSFHFTSGAYKFNQELVIKPPKVRKRNVQKYQHKKPENVVELANDEQNIEEIVEELNSVLVAEFEKNGCKPINYYDYIIDTSDFGITIENMFHFSFLARDGRAWMDMDANGDPLIKPISVEEANKMREKNNGNKQLITSFNHKEWVTYSKPGFLQKARGNGNLKRKK